MVKTSKDLSKAVAAAAEAEQAAARQRDSPEKKQARMDELEERARLFNDSYGVGRVGRTRDTPRHRREADTYQCTRVTRTAHAPSVSKTKRV